MSMRMYIVVIKVNVLRNSENVRGSNNDKEYNSIKANPMMIRIKYQSKNSSGEIVIDRSYYLKIQKKFTRLFKDCTILSFEEIRKEDYYGSIQEQSTTPSLDN